MRLRNGKVVAYIPPPRPAAVAATIVPATRAYFRMFAAVIITLSATAAATYGILAHTMNISNTRLLKYIL